jgi:starch synthase
VFTIHNVAYQGQFGMDTLGVLGLPQHLGNPFALGYPGGISYLKGGTVFAEKVSTVSPTYAREIQGDEHGFGFQDTARSRSADVVGILNGVDYEEWDPRADAHIARGYSVDDLSGKAACKADLLRTFGLPDSPDLPVVGIISRLVWQKGFDVVAEAWWDLLQRPLRMVVLGTGDDAIQAGLAQLALRQPDRYAVRFAYDEGLAHRIMGGSDMFLMPSRSEPCGLTQMYALRYGTVPIVRSTGGLVDTVEPYDPGTEWGTGFRFDTADGTGLVWALDQALGAHGDRARWERLMRRGMTRDLSWERSAREHVTLYRDSSTPVLVDFWAEWCAPCKAMVPDLEAIAGEYAGRVRVCKLNVEENQQVPFQYGITAMPTLIVLKGGQVVEQRVGKMGRAQLAKLLDPIVT